MPAETLFSKYRPCVLGDLQIKGESIAKSDYFYQCIADAVACKSSAEFADVLFEAAEKGTNFGLDFENQNRDGLFDEGQLFAVWEPSDVRALIARLQKINVGLLGHSADAPVKP